MSQNNLDRTIFEIFGRDKVFVEAGGSDPIDQNNTYFLEQNGWSGLIVEPKTNFNDKYSRIRPKTILENFVLVSNEYKEDKILGDFDHYMIGGLINTFNIDNWNEKEYNCCTLQSLLDKHLINEVHFMSLDTEGTEEGIINGIDFNKTFIHLIVVEIHTINGIETNFDFLTEYGFENLYNNLQHKFYFNKKSNYKP